MLNLKALIRLSSHPSLVYLHLAPPCGTSSRAREVPQRHRCGPAPLLDYQVYPRTTRLRSTPPTSSTTSLPRWWTFVSKRSGLKRGEPEERSDVVVPAHPCSDSAYPGNTAPTEVSDRNGRDGSDPSDVDHSAAVIRLHAGALLIDEFVRHSSSPCFGTSP